jgi:hypothetical protein
MQIYYMNISLEVNMDLSSCWNDVDWHATTHYSFKCSVKHEYKYIRHPLTNTCIIHSIACSHTITENTETSIKLGKC